MPETNARERIGPYSDIWARYLVWGVRNTVPHIQPILVGMYGAAFFLLAKKLRRGVMANMRALFPSSGWLANAFRGLRVFHNFASVGVDGVRARAFPGCVEWEIAGLSWLDRLKNWPGGAVVATAHMGNYDLAASAFAERLGRKLNVVRAPERTAELQEVRRREFREATNGAYEVVYNEPGSMLGVTLARMLSQGELVAVQADRVLFEVSSMEVEWEGRRMRLPQGPFVLALTAKCPIFPLFITRLGCLRYRIEVREPIWCLAETPAEKQAAVRKAARQWTEVLGDQIYRHWDQWLVVESAFLGARA